MKREAASEARKRIHDLRAERRKLEELLIEAPGLLRGSLIEKYELAGGKKRSSPAFYLSVPLPGRRHVLEYVPQSELDRVRKRNEAYRSYRRALSRLRALSKEIPKEFDVLGRCLEEPLR